MQRAPGLPCALFIEGGKEQQQTSGEMRREIANLSPSVIARLDRAIQYSRDSHD
ncbi:hypothetical protein [Bradyrhizobium sp.]|uniref:hypothetical protein n=1 Tax=Bradyrhizobium sp. TaxID=376 RepID=UPI0025B95223|nr:hypothetical protein [Bradyrhizobium sp.]